MSVKKIINDIGVAKPKETDLAKMDKKDVDQVLVNALHWSETTQGDESSKLMLQSFILLAMCKNKGE